MVTEQLNERKESRMWTHVSKHQITSLLAEQDQNFLACKAGNMLESKELRQICRTSKTESSGSAC